ncbi:MAG TPA: site-2 protease family protein [Blastocatellia bacterium]|nr:site-2 protease family protein [Blastocatellia bacterium]
MDFDPGELIIWFVVLLFSLSFHESAHAWTSERFGDSTGRYQGRITLNPLPHIDVFGTILFPIIGFVTGFPLLGWAKPVQTNPLMWRDKTKANISVSAAGPISNFILATVALITIKILITAGLLFPFQGFFTLVVPMPGSPAFMEPLAKLLSVMLMLNVALGVFNFIPVPPLDGSHVLEEVLPDEMAHAYEQIRPYGFLLLYALLFLGVFTAIFIPVRDFVVFLVHI